ncbi:hypothetical protein NQZ68_021794 [Dissostichus eleginoides]|nr:hypothetical protein NQZ68_021794 [Dissostichus eleginoides]
MYCNGRGPPGAGAQSVSGPRVILPAPDSPTDPQPASPPPSLWRGMDLEPDHYAQSELGSCPAALHNLREMDVPPQLLTMTYSTDRWRSEVPSSLHFPSEPQALPTVPFTCQGGGIQRLQDTLMSSSFVARKLPESPVIPVAETEKDVLLILPAICHLPASLVEQVPASCEPGSM